MGCTYRLFHREALQRIRPHLTIGGSHFGPQLLMEVIAHGIPFIEIPVNYRRRVGESSVTGDLWKAFWLGMRMITLVLSYRFGLQPATRIRWDDAGRRRNYTFPQHIASSSGVAQDQADLVALIEQTQDESGSQAPTADPPRHSNA
jgi:hypothetical protein